MPQYSLQLKDKKSPTWTTNVRRGCCQVTEVSRSPSGQSKLVLFLCSSRWDAGIWCRCGERREIPSLILRSILTTWLLVGQAVSSGLWRTRRDDDSELIWIASLLFSCCFTLRQRPSADLKMNVFHTAKTNPTSSSKLPAVSEWNRFNFRQATELIWVCQPPS